MCIRDRTNTLSTIAGEKTAYTDTEGVKVEILEKESEIYLDPGPVSYTHLDVYKRQDLCRRNHCQKRLGQG